MLLLNWYIILQLIKIYINYKQLANEVPHYFKRQMVLIFMFHKKIQKKSWKIKAKIYQMTKNAKNK